MVLGCTASGKKFAPMEILKGKTVLKEKFPAGVVVQVSQKGWMDEDTTKKWVNECFSKRLRGFFSSMRDLGRPWQCARSHHWQHETSHQDSERCDPGRNDQISPALGYLCQLLLQSFLTMALGTVDDRRGSLAHQDWPYEMGYCPRTVR